jgi:hypothetical protein
MSSPSAGRTREVTAAVVALAAALLAPRPALALVRPLSFAELNARSETVVAGEVVSLRAHRADVRGLGEVILTDVRIRVRRVLKGKPEIAEVTVTVLGGEIDGRFQLCRDSPRYDEGEAVLVFLRERDGRLWNTGWLQGKYRLENGGTVVRGRRSLPLTADAALADVAARITALSTSPSPGGGSR